MNYPSPNNYEKQTKNRSCQTGNGPVGTCSLDLYPGHQGIGFNQFERLYHLFG